MAAGKAQLAAGNLFEQPVREGQAPEAGLLNPQTRTAQQVSLLRPVGDPDLLVRPLLIRNIILHMYGEFDASQTGGEEAYRCAQQAGDRWGEAYADFLLGLVAYLRGNHRAGYQQMRRRLGMLRRENDPRTLAMGLNFISPAGIALGYYEEVEAFLQESLGICEELGDRWGMGTALRFLGQAALAQGDVARAQDLLQRSLDVHRGFVVGWDIARTLTYLGNAALALGQIEEARRCYREAQQWAKEAGSQPAALDALAGLAEVEAKTGRQQRALALARAILEDSASSQDARATATRLCTELTG